MASHSEHLGVPTFASFTSELELLADCERLPVWKLPTLLAAARGACSAAEYDFDFKTDTFVHETARIHASAIVYSSVVGPGGIVHEFATVRNSVIGPLALIGHASEIARSFVSARSMVTHFGYLGDSFVGTDVMLGGGVRTANRRIDGAGIRFEFAGSSFRPGIQSFGAVVGDDARLAGGVHLNPGTLIGRGSVIDPGLEIRGHIPSRARVRRSFDFTIEVEAEGGRGDAGSHCDGSS